MPLTVSLAIRVDGDTFCRVHVKASQRQLMNETEPRADNGAIKCFDPCSITSNNIAAVEFARSLSMQMVMRTTG
jgi:hypothetical protein